MTLTSKKSAFPNKNQLANKVETKTKPLKDTATEIDDLFSVLSAAKKTKVEPVPGAAVKNKKSDEVTVSDLEGLDEEDDIDGGDLSEYEYESEYESDSNVKADDSNRDSIDADSSAEVVKGVAYDPKRDDDFPVASKLDLGSDDFFDSRGLKRKTRPLTEDGLPIFSPRELKIGLGGGTDLCPFDCNCCF